MGSVVNAKPRPFYPSEREALPAVQGRSGRVRKISPPTGIRSPDRPARSELLYRLSLSIMRIVLESKERLGEVCASRDGVHRHSAQWL